MCILMCLAFYFSCRTDCMAFGFHSTKCQISPLVGDWLQWAQWTLFPTLSILLSHQNITLSSAPALANLHPLICGNSLHLPAQLFLGPVLNRPPLSRVFFLTSVFGHTWENMTVVERRGERSGYQDLLLPFALIMELCQVFSRCTIQIDFLEPCLRLL